MATSAPSSLRGESAEMYHYGAVITGVSDGLVRFLAVRVAALGTVVLVVLGLVACGADDRRLGGGRPGGAPQATVDGNSLTLSGAVDEELTPDGPPSCSPTTVALYGTIGGEKLGLAVFAPFANFPGGQTIDLPPPSSIDAGVRLNGLRAGPWRADASAGSGRITVELNLQTGSFDADLVADDGSRVHAVGTWRCSTGGPVATPPPNTSP
jgi:hypothetical protein